MIKKVGKEEFEILRGWWAERPEWGQAPEMFLPDDGFLAYINDKPVIGAYLYTSGNGGSAAWFTWFIADPRSSSEDRKIGLQEIIQAANDFVKPSGVKVLFSDSPVNSLTESLVEKGFIETDKGITHLFKLVG